MRKVLLTYLILLFLVITACSSDAYPELMPESKGEYSIFWLRGEGEVHEKPPIFDKVNKVMSHSNLNKVNERYANLNLEKQPAFVIFDDGGVVLKTYDREEAVDFLEEIYQEK